MTVVWGVYYKSVIFLNTNKTVAVCFCLKWKIKTCKHVSCIYTLFKRNTTTYICIILYTSLTLNPKEEKNVNYILRYFRKSLKIPKGGNQNPYIKEEEETTQWPKEKVQKDKQWSTKHTHKTIDYE